MWQIAQLWKQSSHIEYIENKMNKKFGSLECRNSPELTIHQFSVKYYKQYSSFMIKKCQKMFLKKYFSTRYIKGTLK